MKKVKFKTVYTSYLLLLLVLSGLCIGYTYITLEKYEEKRPEAKLSACVDQLVTASAEPDFWEEYFPDIEKTENLSEEIKEDYLSLFSKEEITYLLEKNDGNRLSYLLQNNGVNLARVELRASQEEETKLLVLQFRDWEVENMEAILEVTRKSLVVSESYEVRVNGEIVEKDGRDLQPDKDYELVKEYVENIPEIIYYELEVLGKNPMIEVYDDKGNSVSAGEKENYYIMDKIVEAALTEELKDEIDPMEVAKKWSLFMSNDLPFSVIDDYLIEDSFQYNVAKQYATGVDISFTSEHTLANPAFTDEKIQNIVWLSEGCFSVDISFKKHMVLGWGKVVEDTMNDRFYFYKQGESNYSAVGEGWKLVGMKEIVNYEGE